MVRRITALLFVLGIVVGSCSSEGLSDAEREWCSHPDNGPSVAAAAHNLDLEYPALLDTADPIPGRGLLVPAWLDTSDGVRACETAYRTR